MGGGGGLTWKYLTIIWPDFPRLALLTMLILEGVRVRVLRTEATDTLLSAQLCLDDRR